MDLPRVGRIVTEVARRPRRRARRGLCTATSSRRTSSSAGRANTSTSISTDFGLTKRLGSSGGLTRAGGWVGTPDYVAPEQIQRPRVDGRADVYSLGCVLYEMLTGDVAYPKDSDMAKLWAHVSDPPPLPRTQRPELVEAFDEVVARATAKDPADRYATAGELAAALRDAISEQEQHEGHTRVAARPIAITREPSAAAGAAPDAEPMPEAAAPGAAAQEAAAPGAAAPGAAAPGAAAPGARAAAHEAAAQAAVRTPPPARWRGGRHPRSRRWPHRTRVTARRCARRAGAAARWSSRSSSWSPARCRRR